MTDINGTVVGLQGNAVSSSVPNDGYVLTWDAANSEWVAKPIPPATGLRKNYFTSNGTWTAPTEVTNVLVIAAGGGGGGMGGSGGSGQVNIGGGAALQQASYVSVISGNTYDIHVGAGGTGGPGFVNGSVASRVGNNGENTTLTLSSTVLFSAAGAAGGDAINYFGNNLPIVLGTNTYNQLFNLNFIAATGGGFDANGNQQNGNINYLNGYLGGTAGATNTFRGGSGGGAGPQGNGGNGGNGANNANASNGGTAATNTAAGGGGGGNCNTGFTGGTGGTGGSGYLYIIY